MTMGEDHPASRCDTRPNNVFHGATIIVRGQRTGEQAGSKAGQQWVWIAYIAAPDGVSIELVHRIA
jgi:hypothetical protein